MAEPQYNDVSTRHGDTQGDQMPEVFHPVEKFGEFPWGKFNPARHGIGRYNIRNEEGVYIHIDERTPDGEGVNEFWEIPNSLESLLWQENDGDELESG